MMGRRTLAEIRRDISQRLKAEGIDEEALLKDLYSLQERPRKDVAAIEALSDLMNTLKRAKSRKRSRTATVSKVAP